MWNTRRTRTLQMRPPASSSNRMMDRATRNPTGYSPVHSPCTAESFILTRLASQWHSGIENIANEHYHYLEGSGGIRISQTEDANLFIRPVFSKTGTKMKKIEPRGRYTSRKSTPGRVSPRWTSVCFLVLFRLQKFKNLELSESFSLFWVKLLWLQSIWRLKSVKCYLLIWSLSDASIRAFFEDFISLCQKIAARVSDVF